MSLLRRIERGNKYPPDNPDAENKLAQMRARRLVPPGAPQYSGLYDLKARAQQQVRAELEKLQSELDSPLTPELIRTAVLPEIFNTYLAEESIVLSRAERTRLFEQIFSDLFGFGPLDPLLLDEAISSIMINGPKNIYLERSGRMQRAPAVFEDETHVNTIVRKLCEAAGVTYDEQSARLEGTLPDGMTFCATMRPVSLAGPLVTLDKPVRQPLTLDDLIRFGSVTPEMARLLGRAVAAGCNILVCGNSGVVAFTHVLTGLLPLPGRVLAVNSVRGGVGYPGSVLLHDDLRPSQIWGDFPADCVHYMAVEANSAYDALESMLLGQTIVSFYSEAELANALNTLVLFTAQQMTAHGLTVPPNETIRREWLARVDLVVEHRRLRDGSRKIVSISEPNESMANSLYPLFTFQQTTIEGGKVMGRFLNIGQPTSELQARLQAALPDEEP